jgi:hypothetical protein
MKKSYLIIIVLGILFTLTRVILLEFYSADKQWKIGLEIALASLIALSVICNVPKIRLLNYILWNWLFLFLILEISNLTVYAVLRNSKFLENIGAMILFGAILSLIASVTFTLIGSQIKRKRLLKLYKNE